MHHDHRLVALNGVNVESIRMLFSYLMQGRTCSLRPERGVGIVPPISVRLYSR
jgi:hypothetical protein